MTPPYLSPHHWSALRASGLTDASIEKRGYQTAQFKQALTAAGFSDWQAKQLPALLIPIYDVTGQLNMYQMRPDTAPVIDGKSFKYMTPKGGALCLDVPRSVQPLLKDVSVPLWITEGSKKVDAAVQYGLCCIGALGVTGWMRGGAPLPDWEHIALKGRDVFLAFDADAQKKLEVWRALQAIDAMLRGQGARVWFVYLPDDPTDPTKKIGLDDYLLQHSVTELQALASPDLCAAPSASHSQPRTQLEKLRAEALAVKMRGLADVNPHGGLKFSKDATAEEIEKAAKALRFFYGRIDDLKKWDFIDCWFAACPHIAYGEGAKWKAVHFGRYAKQVNNWISNVGAFGPNTDGRRRSHLPMWLHEMIRALPMDDQEYVFDAFESAGRMTQKEAGDVMKTRGCGPTAHEAKSKEETGTPSKPGSSLIGYSPWQELAQKAPETLAVALVKLIHVYDNNMPKVQQILEVAAQSEKGTWEEPETAAEDENEADEDIEENDVEFPDTCLDFFKKNEFETSRQTSRTVFTAVKTEDTENAPEISENAPDFRYIQTEGGEFSSTTNRETKTEQTGLQETFTDLIAHAHAGRLPAGRTMELQPHKTISDMNRVVLSALERQDTQTLQECAAVWQQETASSIVIEEAVVNVSDRHTNDPFYRADPVYRRRVDRHDARQEALKPHYAPLAALLGIYETMLNDDVVEVLVRLPTEAQKRALWQAHRSHKAQYLLSEAKLRRADREAAAHILAGAESRS